MINTMLIPYHAAVVFAMAMSVSQAQTNPDIVSHLYWLIPVNLLLASIPNLLVILIYFVWKKQTPLITIFLIAEGYIVFLQTLLHGALILFSMYGPNI